MPLGWGGPYLGFMATVQKHMRKLPDRIVGQTVDSRGQRCFVLSLQAREQHIRREKASSNICSNEALCALTASVYMAVMGPEGMAEAARQCLSKAHYLAKALCAIPGVSLRYPGNISTSSSRSFPGAGGAGGAGASRHSGRPAGRGRHPVVRHGEGLPCRAGRDRRRGEGGAEQMKLIFEKSVPYRRCSILPRCDVEEVQLPQELRRQEAPALPELSEVDLSRHYTELCQHVHGVNCGFYPLGSCTMKYNPRIDEEMAALPGFAGVHPLAPEHAVAGCREVLDTASRYLCQITGMDGMTFQPAAGAHGEFTGVLLIKQYHDARGDHQRTKIIVPDSAHGTNPATAAMCGYQVVNIPSAADGCVDLEALKAVLGDDVAGLMLTNPNTVGIFDENILEITRLVHEAGGLCYYDGANLNAVMGIVRPRRHGL